MLTTLRIIIIIFCRVRFRLVVGRISVIELDSGKLILTIEGECGHNLNLF